MLTVVVSDLHLGSRTCALETPPLRDALLGRIGAADEVVLLGDVLSLREGPAQEVLETARPLLAAIGDAAAGARLLLVPGNHDHALRAGPLLAAVEDALGREAEVAYPGVWLRKGVFATHGHYLDCHMAVPRPECLAARAMALAGEPVPRRGATAADYEALLAPLYAFAQARAENGQDGGLVPGRVREAVFAQLRGGPRAAGIAAMLGAAVAARALGLGPFSVRLSADRIGRAGLAAMAEVAARLGLGARHVIFGHTHRAEPGWVAPDGTVLVNCGSWLYEPALAGPARARDPSLPGAYVAIADGDRPELRWVV